MRKKPFVFISQRVPDEIIQTFPAHYDVEMWSGAEPVPYEILAEKAEEADALFVMLTDIIDAKLLNRAKNLKIVSTMSVGIDHIDMAAAKGKGITVANTPGILTEATADLAFALMMAAGRKLIEASEYVRNGLWMSWSPMLLAGQDIYGATLGIVGMGSIGQAVARRAKGFGMNVLYHNRKRNEAAENAMGVSYRSLEQLLRESDFVVLLTPLTDETKGLMGKEQFAMMKPTSVFVNVSRGATVDEQALYEALIDGQIWAAGLDVFQQEPIPTDHQLLQLPNVVALPHIGSASIRTRLAMGRMAARSIVKELG